MNHKQITLIVVSIALIVLGGVGYFFYTKGVPFLQTIGLFPGEGLPVGTTEGEPEEEVNIRIFVPGVDDVSMAPRLYELHKTPVAGVGFMETGLTVSAVTTSVKKSAPKIKIPAVPSTPPPPHTVTARYIERALGHIYETPLATYQESRIVNETRPRISEAFFGRNSKSVVVRYLDEEYSTEFIRTRILNLASTSTSSDGFLTTEEVILPDFIPFMAVAEDGTDNMFYLLSTLTSSLGTLTSSVGTGAAVFTSSFTEWLPQFPSQSMIALTTRPSQNVPGYLFFLNPKTKALTKVLDGINGLTTKVSRDGKFILYSATGDDGRLDLFVYNVADKEQLGLVRRTLPEKCAWSTKESTVAYCAVPRTLERATYPDQWYRGTVSFSDDMWKIDVVTGRTEKVFTPTEYRAPEMDIINPVLASDDSYLLFMNKKSGTPWVYRIVDVAPVQPMPIPVTIEGATIGGEGAPVATTSVPAMSIPTVYPAQSTTDGMMKIR